MVALERQLIDDKWMFTAPQKLVEIYRTHWYNTIEYMIIYAEKYSTHLIHLH